MKVREVYLGTAAVANKDAFIELQMYEAGQNHVAGRMVNYYDETGVVTGGVPITNDVQNGENQRTVLLGDTAVPGRDVESTSLGEGFSYRTAGGALCFENIDCVSWGNFNGTLPSPAGAPAPAPPEGSSLTRSIAPSCPTLLEDADDTGNSAADLALTAPSPRPNATPPTETACAPGGGAGGPETTITRQPKNKVERKGVTYGFSSSDPTATFQCSENGDPFESCTSPHRFKADKGKNEFEVRAVNASGPDFTPAGDKFRFKKPK